MNETEFTVKQGGIEGTEGVQHRVLSVCGGPVSVYEAGNSQNPAVVLLHGAMYDEARFCWDQLFPALAKQYHVFAVDTPRHGASRPWSGTLERARLLEILNNTFAQILPERFSIVGLSMGGGLAIEYAALHPEQVVSMALFEPGGLGETVTGELFTYLYIHTPGMLRLLSKKYVKLDRGKIEKLLCSIYTGGSVPTDPERLTAILEDEIRGKFDSGENDMDDWQLSAIAPFRLKWNLLGTIPLLRCPTLWLRGNKSILVKQSEMERAVLLAQKSGASAELLVVPNAGHILPLERPETANRAVLEFLGRTVKQAD
ncbi:MAG: alpha/beta hydrolase [Clostridiaceae bacterium]